MHGTNYTTAGLLQANSLAYSYGGAVHTLFANTNAAATFKWAIGGTALVNEMMSLSTTALTAPSFVKSGGTSAQFLKANGSVDSSTYVTGSPGAAGRVMIGTSATNADGNAQLTYTNNLINTVSSTGIVSMQVINSNGGAGSRSLVQVDNGTYVCNMNLFGTGYTTSGLLLANSASLTYNGNVGFMFLNSAASTYFKWAIGGTTLANEVMGLTTTTLTFSEGLNIVTGTTTGTKHGTSTNQKQSFWNATPIIQPTTAISSASFVANTSAIANDTATFDGYTIGQIVKALRNIGLLA